MSKSDVHVHPNNRQNDHHKHYSYHKNHNKTTKERRRIFVRQNLYTVQRATWKGLTAMKRDLR